MQPNIIYIFPYSKQHTVGSLMLAIFKKTGKLLTLFNGQERLEYWNEYIWKIGGKIIPHGSIDEENATYQPILLANKLLTESDEKYTQPIDISSYKAFMMVFDIEKVEDLYNAKNTTNKEINTIEFKAEVYVVDDEIYLNTINNISHFNIKSDKIFFLQNNNKWKDVQNEIK